MHTHSLGSWQHQHVFLGTRHDRNEHRTWLGRRPIRCKRIGAVRWTIPRLRFNGANREFGFCGCERPVGVWAATSCQNKQFQRHIS